MWDDCSDRFIKLRLFSYICTQGQVRIFIASLTRSFHCCTFEPVNLYNIPGQAKSRSVSNQK